MLTEITFTVPKHKYFKLLLVSEQEQFGYEMDLLRRFVQLEIDWQLMVYFLINWRGQLDT